MSGPPPTGCPSSGTALVPNVVGTLADKARDKLEDSGFRVEVKPSAHSSYFSVWDESNWTVESYLAHHQQPTTSYTPTGDGTVEPIKGAGSGTAHPPEMVALAEVIEKINDLFDGDHPESSVRSVITHLKDRLEESETLQQQARSNSLQQFSASPDLQQEFTDAVLGAMDSSADLYTQIINNPDIFQKLLSELIPIIYKELRASASH